MTVFAAPLVSRHTGCHDREPGCGADREGVSTQVSRVLPGQRGGRPLFHSARACQGKDLFYIQRGHVKVTLLPRRLTTHVRTFLLHPHSRNLILGTAAALMVQSSALLVHGTAAFLQHATVICPI